MTAIENTPLEKLKEVAVALSETAGELGALKIDATITTPVGRYFVRIERVYRRQGRGKQATEVYDRTQVTVRESTHQGTILFSGPLGWLS